MSRHKLNKSIIDGLIGREDRYDVFDTALPGFHVRVFPSGAISYRLKYVSLGRQRITTIGTHGAPWTADQARKRASILRGQIDSGRDPIREREEARVAAEEDRKRAITVTELAERWLIDGRAAAPNKREISWTTDERKLKRHILPLLGRHQVRSLSRSDIENAQQQIANGATSRDERTGKPRGRAIVRGGKGVARSSVLSLSACLSWAMGQGIIDKNPCFLVKKEKPRKKERFLTQDEAKALLDTIDTMERRRELRRDFADIARLLLLTGARKSEIQGLRWEELDLGRGYIILPRERSKTGEKLIPLSAPAATILASRTRVGEFVFPAPSNSKAPTTGLQKAWEKVRARANLTDLRLHDLRHSFASFAAANGASLVMIGKALGHVQPSTTARYAHLGLDPVKELAERVGATISEAQARAPGPENGES